MKVLDRYLTRELIFPIIFACVTLVLLFIVADLFDNLDELLTNKIPTPIIFEYYGSLVPFSFVQIVAWASWLGTVYLLVHFGLNNELMAMKASGLKMTAIVRPILFLGFLIGIFVFLVNELVVPPTYKNAGNILEVHIEQNTPVSEKESVKNMTHYSGEEQLIYFRKFFPSEYRAEDVIVIWLSEVKLHTYKKLVAKKAIFNGSSWDFYQITEYYTDSQGRILGKPNILDRQTYNDVTVSPRELLNAASENVYLSIYEMKHAIETMEKNGVPTIEKKVDFYQRLATPWMSLLMMLITIPLLSPIRTRKAIAIKVLLCVGFIFGFYVLGAVFLALGKSGKLPPIVAAWGYPIIIATVAYYKLSKADFQN